MNISIYNEQILCYNIIKRMVVKRAFDNNEVIVCLLDERKNSVN